MCLLSFDSVVAETLKLCSWQVGDRPFTDIVYGNRNGFLTILTEPLSVAEEPFIVKQVCSVSFSVPSSTVYGISCNLV